MPVPLPTDPALLTGAQRAAVLVVALGLEAASALLPALEDDEVERVTVEIARLDRVPADLVAAVLTSFEALLEEAAGPDAAGGLEAARELLRSGLDEARAGAILPRVEAATEGTGFDLVRAVPSEELAAFLTLEHPQTAAVVLSQLPARPAADVLGHLPEARRGDVIRRLSALEAPPAAALAAVDAALRERFGARSTGPDGVKRAADILMQSGRSTGQIVLDDLRARQPDLADRIESLLFVFEDLARVDGRALGRILAAADQAALARALHGADDALRERVFGSVSERVGAALQEEMEMAGSPSPSDVEDAQRTVVGVALELADAGEISLEAVPVEA